MVVDQQSLHDSLLDTHIHTSNSMPHPIISAQQQLPPQQQQQQQQQQQNHHPHQPQNGEHSPVAEGVPLTNGQPENHVTTSEAADAFNQAEYGINAREEDDFDQGYDTDDSAASTSLASSARDFIYENGRRYHAYRAGSYLFPNDEPEQDREDLKHAMFLKLFNKTLHFAPVPKDGVFNVLDLGTGTGIWALDFADQYSDASVLGIDLSPTQTTWIPPNLKFMVDDAESEWLHPPNHFDYIHHRHTIQAFRDWPTMYRRAFEHMKPGGYLEAQEIDHFPRADDGTLPADCAMSKYWDIVANAMGGAGVAFRDAPRLAQYMRDAGFINVVERVFYTPIGPWPRNRQLRETGNFWRAVVMDGLEAIALGPLTRYSGWSKMEVDVFLASVRKAYLDRNIHSYMPFYIVYGQKPFNS